ncbi:recombinase RecT [Burkholderia multivorans]|uniref:recombinase RecT n=1 Tax=Burkholderia multivorans TaxID=87883 RepID=UPI0019D26BD0|nr:recombinase RecT [Burkholderia multivorans]MBN6728752.1 recombinase RecT [Burkholderia multivorans]
MATTTNLAQLKSTSKMVAREAGIGSVKQFFESQKGTLAAVLPRHVSPDRMLKIALGALRTTPKLMECTVESLMGAVVQCSQLGLEPNTPLGHAYLIPFEKKKKVGGEWVTEKVETQIVIGYKGLIDLARRSGQVVSIAAHAVHEHDHFDYAFGLDEKLEHKPAMSARGRVIAFYAVAKLVGGGHAFEVMSAEQVNEIRDASQNYKFARDKSKTVWGQHYEEMGRKTVLRRLFKYLPVSIELASAAAIDDVGTAGRSQALDTVLDGDYITPTDDEQDDDGEIDPPAGLTDQRQQQADMALPSYDDLLSQIRNAKDEEVLALVLDSARDLPQAEFVNTP